MIRSGTPGLGRYFGWYDAWVFRDRERGDSSLYLVRRIQATPQTGLRFEVTISSGPGSIRREVLRPWQLGRDYRTLRSSQFVSDFGTMPLSLLPLFGFPVLFVLFPIAPIVCGVVMLRSANRAERSKVATSPLPLLR